MYRCLNPGALGLNVSFAEGMELARAHGFGGLEFGLPTAMEMGVAKAKQALDAAGLRPGSWGLPVRLWAEEAEYRQALARLPEAAAAARELGSTRFATFLMSFSDDLPFAENFRRHVDRIRPAAEKLAAGGCSLGLEFLGPLTIRAGHRHNFVYTMDGMLALAAAIGTGNVGLLLDAWHWYTAGGCLTDLEKLAASDVVTVHINDAPQGIPIAEQVDNVRRLPGETGVIDLVGFLKALHKIGYDGPIVPEPFSAKLQGLPPAEAVRLTAEPFAKVWRAAGLA
jgi:sugar phosphate isomerase/epimerase